MEFARIGEGRYVLDVKGYVCPYLVIYTRKVLAKLKSDEILEVLTDNPPSCENVPRSVEEDGHKVEKVEGTRLTIAPREDADVFPRSENGVGLYRRIYGLGGDAKVNPDEIRKISPSRAVVVV